LVHFFDLGNEDLLFFVSDVVFFILLNVVFDCGRKLGEFDSFDEGLNSVIDIFGEVF
jgi:hypothetical protein